ncbi:type II toxin-antitoxin system HicA family toxin [Companilactobacillus ginsenosidimutans]|uniref:Toxin-antitoxin system, toxin component, HicA family protein n=1 Tax=Companilactobacillus ginsenosidimutans TaxID=1007676 RepID=A0A0H4QMG8_9LACO|nr:type II toxin-antitoxin system HicA family toxin [Companilactobacillus ginsenosidimutans]AKP68316.1 toxin-antitoxin system, toxin component, HicA family protein [Companilactobacillus ginsenosidimutans]
MPMNQRQMIKILRRNGWLLIKNAGKGSHAKLQKAGNRPIIVPHGEIDKYTEQNIIKAAGLKNELG